MTEKKKYLDLAGLGKVWNAIKAKDDALDARVESLETAVGDGGSVSEKITEAIDALDTTADVAVASKNENDIVTISGSIKEVDGIISKGSAADVTLAKVAVTGNAADIAIADASGKFDATTVEAALTEVAEKISDASSDAAITVEKTTGGADDSFVSKYTFKQGGVAIANGEITIGKDLVATSGELVNSDGTNVGTFIKMTIANGTPFYIDVKDLIEYNAVSSTDEITLTDNNHTISATVGKIAASKIVVGKDSESGNDITLDEKIASLENASSTGVDSKITAAVEALDAEVSQTAASGNGFVNVSVKEVDGKLTEVTASIPAETYDSFGAASAAETAAKTYTDNNALFEVEHGTDGSYVTTTVGTKASNKQSVGVAVTVQEVSTASDSAKGLAEASDVKSYVDTAVAGVNSTVTGLNAEVTSTDGTNVQVKVTESAGKITAVNVTTDNTVNATDVANKIQTEIEKLDSEVAASVDANATVTTTAVAVVTGIKEVDGKLDSVTSVDFEPIDDADLRGLGILASE